MMQPTTPLRPTGGRTLRRLLLPLLLALLVVPAGALSVGVTPAEAGSDDFEFGQKLAAKGRARGDQAWFELARRVFQSILDDSGRDQRAKNEARYGLAGLSQGRALAASANREIPYAEVKKLFDQAVSGLEKFVNENPKHPLILEAKMKVGLTRLGFAQWARRLLDDAEDLEERKAEVSRVQRDAKGMIDAAVRYFDALSAGWDNDVDPPPIAPLARFQLMSCRYHAARLLNPCSSGANAAFKQLLEDLDEFVGWYDGTPVGTYAMDIMGLACQELAECSESEEEKEDYYGQAFDWFESCAITEWEDLNSLRIIARGYYHLGQCCLKAGRIGDQNFLKKGAKSLRKMKARVTSIGTMDDGIKAMMEWGKIENALGNSNQAIKIVAEAGKEAADSGRPWLEARCNRVIAQILASGSSGGGSATISPDILKRVADNQYNTGELRAAIGAYQKVIAACRGTTEDLMAFEIPAWNRISACYAQLGDLLSAVLATEPIHAAWLDGRIPRKKDDPNDPNLDMAARLRMKAIGTMDKLFRETEIPEFGARFKAMQASVSKDYHPSPITKDQLWGTAVNGFNEALRQKKGGNSQWRQTLQAAVKAFRQIASEDAQANQHAAWVYVVRAAYTNRKWADVVKEADAALKAFADPALAARIQKHETIGPRVRKAEGQVKVWKAVAQLEQERHKDVVATLGDWDKDYGEIVKGEYYPATALGTLVSAYVGGGDIENGLAAHKRLLRKFPGYFRLPNITFDLAKYYESRYDALAETYKGHLRLLRGTEEDIGLLSQRRDAEREAGRIRGQMSVERGRATTLRRKVAVWEDAVAEAKGTGKEPEVKGVNEDDYEKAKKELNGDPDAEKPKDKAGVLKEIDRLTKALNTEQARAEDLDAKVAAETKAMRALEQQMYDPLVRAANLYYEWDQVLKLQKGDRTWQNVSTFGYRYFYATQLDPSDPQNWHRARELYEDVVEMDGVPEDKIVETQARLGRIYSHLATLEEDATKRQSLLNDAVEFLQHNVARNPANSALLISLLSGERVVLPFESKIQQRRYYFPIRLVADVADFKKAIKEIGTAAGPIPVYRDDARNRAYASVIGEFQKYVDDLSDKQIKHTVGKFAKASFDVGFYKAYGTRSSDFRLSLARAWARSGKPVEAIRAVNLCRTLVDSSIAAAEDSETYWEAHEVRIQAYISAARGGIGSSKDEVKARTKDLLDRASAAIRALHSQNESLGKGIRDATKPNLKALLKELDRVRADQGLSVTGVDLDRPPAGGTNIPSEGEAE